MYTCSNDGGVQDPRGRGWDLVLTKMLIRWTVTLWQSLGRLQRVQVLTRSFETNASDSEDDQVFFAPS